MKNGVAYKNQNMYRKINIYLKQASSLPFKPLLPSYRNQLTDLWSKPMGCFLYNGNTGLKYTNPNHHFFHILFPSFMKKSSPPPFSHVSNLSRHDFHKSIKPRMQTVSKQCNQVSKQ